MPTLSAVVEATKEQIFEILTDYKNYADWTADVVDARVLAQEGDVVVAEFISPELMKEKYVLEFVHSKPTSVEYRQVDQFGSRGLSGSWSLADLLDKKSAILTGEMNLRTSPRKSLSNRKKVRLVLQRRIDVIKQMFSHPPATEEDALPAAMVELVSSTGRSESGADLAVWYRGNKYLVRRLVRR